jgi:hypothetical protein
VQHFIVVNITKRQFLDPAAFGEGRGLLDFGASGSGTMLGLAVLLASGCNQGLRELQDDHPLIGSWSGDRIAIAGNLDKNIFTELQGSEFRLLPIAPSLYEVARRLYDDISDRVLEVIAGEPYEKRALENKGALPKKGD